MPALENSVDTVALRGPPVAGSQARLEARPSVFTLAGITDLY